jgi:hypothetical protein
MEREPGMSWPGTLSLRVLQAVGRRLPYGTSVYEREWDTLVVLDACRADLLREVAPDAPFLDAVETTWSVGSSSSEWLANTFERGPDAAVADTAMVTGNTWTDRYLDPDRFALLDEVWKYAWDEDLGTVPAAAVTDRALAVARDHDPARLVVHYMQPHHPFVADPLDGDGGMVRGGEAASTTNPWVLLRRGAVDPERVWRAYEATLRAVLEEVGALVENCSGRVAVTADHGNLFGEWGLYGHPMHTPVPALLRVPWAETEGAGRRSRETELVPPEPLPVSRVYGAGETDRLDALGYL